MLATAVAIVLPTLIVQWFFVGYAVFAQIVSVLLWGLALTLWGISDRSSQAPWRSLAPVAAATLLLILGVAVSVWRVDSPAVGPAINATGLVLAAFLTASIAARLGSGHLADAAVASLSAGLIVAAFVGSAIGLLQLAATDFPDGWWIAAPLDRSRAWGNFLQANMLATLCVLALAGAVCGQQAGWSGRWSWWISVAVLPASVGLTASRIGASELMLLAAWSVLDRSLPRHVRWGLLLAPLICIGVIALVQTIFVINGWAVSDMSRPSYRIETFTAAWRLINWLPGLGLGWSELGTAWALSPLVDPVGLLTDNAHNLALQLAVELGWPLGLLIFLLLIWALITGAKRCLGSRHTGLLMMLLVMSAHSMVEYPLWFAFFLLPTSWALGLALAGPATPVGPPRPGGIPPLWAPAGLAVLVGALFTLADFARALPALLNTRDTARWTQPLQQVQDSRLFSHHVALVAVMEAPHPPLPLFQLARHSAIDRCFLLAWADALAQDGRADDARHLLERVKYYPHWGPTPWLAACRARQVAALPSGPPTQPVDWRRLRR